MPHLIPTPDSETPALLALRRTLWQLAILGIATATTLARIAPDSGSLALWCVLIPLSALAVHFRQTLLNLLLSHRRVHRDRATPRRMQRVQARRARGDDNAASKRRQARARLLRQAQLNQLAR